jgi:hypothetical protein
MFSLLNVTPSQGKQDLVPGEVKIWPTKFEPPQFCLAKYWILSRLKTKEKFHNSQQKKNHGYSPNTQRNA